MYIAREGGMFDTLGKQSPSTCWNDVIMYELENKKRSETAKVKLGGSLLF